MGTTFTYRGWSNMTHIEVTHFENVMEPGVPGSSQRAATRTIVEGTGIVTMTADANSSTGARRRIDDIRRLLSTPGGSLSITVDGVTLVNHVSEDYKTGGAGETTDFEYGPVISANITELSGARCALVRWRVEMRQWSDVTNLHPITGFVVRLTHEYDRTGYLTLRRSGILAVRRSAGFPTRDGLGLEGSPPPTVIGFLPTTMPFGGGQSPVSAGIASTTTIGNNPDLYRRFVAGPIFKGFIRESQQYYVDETFQKLFFSVVDRQIATPYPAIVTRANVDFDYGMNIESGSSVFQKQFRAELTGRPDTPKSQLLSVAVAMSKNRINWSSDQVGADLILRMNITEPDMMNQNTLGFSVVAISANEGFAFAPPGGLDIFASIMNGVVDPAGGATAQPDAYGLLGLVTLQDFIWEADPPGTHVSPNTTGASLMGKVPYGKPVAQVVSVSAASAMQTAFASAPGAGIPPGDHSEEVSEGPQGYFRISGSMHIETDNRLVIGNAATIDGPDRVYQFGKPKVIVTERIAVQRKNTKPSENIAFTPLPWGHVEIGKSGTVSPAFVDANGNYWYTGIYERSSRVLSSAMLTLVDANNRRFSYFGSRDPGALQLKIPQQINPQAKQPEPLAPFLMPPSTLTTP